MAVLNNSHAGLDLGSFELGRKDAEDIGLFRDKAAWLHNPPYNEDLKESFRISLDA
jgi:hypothetical protein